MPGMHFSRHQRFASVSPAQVRSLCYNRVDNRAAATYAFVESPGWTRVPLRPLSWCSTRAPKP
jgi:hypothetical protein